MDEFKNFDEVWKRVSAAGKQDRDKNPGPEKNEKLCIKKPPKSYAVRFLIRSYGA